MISTIRPVFKSSREDFFKIIFPTIFIISLSLIFNFKNYQWFYFALAFLLDQGHVYSTMIEVYLDPSEVKRPYVAKITLLAFFLNLLVLIIFPNLFFYYIFYFTVYHNMRQGLGFVFINQTSNELSRNLVKWLYYFATVTPFLLFHFRYNSEFNLSSAVLKNINLFHYFPYHELNLIFKIGVSLYWFFWAISVFYLWKHKFEGFILFVFFSAVYSIAFLVLKSNVNSYGLLILSHAIPYYFLFAERIKLTHGLSIVRKNANAFMLSFFLLGAMVDYYHEDIVAIFDFPIDKLAVALLLTPLITHFLFDAILWTKNNERFQKQKLLRISN